jgi:hypothetical protein
MYAVSVCPTTGIWLASLLLFATCATLLLRRFEGLL